MNLDLFKEFATNEAGELEGVLVPYKSAKFKIARAGNKNYNKVFLQKYEENKLLLEAKDDAADKLALKIVIDSIAETILVGWESVDFKGVTNFAYSVDNAKTLLAMRDFRDWVMKASDDVNNYKVKEESSELKNSETLSAGSLSGEAN